MNINYPKKKEDVRLYSLGVRSRPTAYFAYKQVSEHM
jgi:hypothetical protein